MWATCTKPKLLHKHPLQIEKKTLDGITIWSTAGSAKMRKVVFSYINSSFGPNAHWVLTPKLNFNIHLPPIHGGIKRMEIVQKMPYEYVPKFMVHMS
jgi:hypothetical protein